MTVIEIRLSTDQRARSGRLCRHGPDRYGSAAQGAQARSRTSRRRRPGALVKSGTTADVYSINASAQASHVRAGRRRLDQSGVLGDLDRSRRIRDPEPNRLLRHRSTSAAATTTRSAMSSTAFRSTARSTTTRRARHRRWATRKSKSTPARTRRRPRAKASRASSIRSSRAEPIPGYATGSLGIGTPAFYHRAAIEIGGSTPDRMFSYYVGVAGLNQSFNYINNNNGSEYDNWLGPVARHRRRSLREAVCPRLVALLRQLRQRVLSARTDKLAEQRRVARTGHDLRPQYRRQLPHRHPASERCRTRRHPAALRRRISEKPVLLLRQRLRLAVLHRSGRTVRERRACISSTARRSPR